MELLIAFSVIIGLFSFAVLLAYAWQIVMETPYLLLMPFVLAYELIKYVLLGFTGLFIAFDWNYYI